MNLKLRRQLLRLAVHSIILTAFIVGTTLSALAQSQGAAATLLFLSLGKGAQVDKKLYDYSHEGASALEADRSSVGD